MRRQRGLDQRGFYKTTDGCDDNDGCDGKVGCGDDDEGCDHEGCSDNEGGDDNAGYDDEGCEHEGCDNVCLKNMGLYKTTEDSGNNTGCDDSEGCDAKEPCHDNEGCDDNQLCDDNERCDDGCDDISGHGQCVCFARQACLHTRGILLDAYLRMASLAGMLCQECRSEADDVLLSCYCAEISVEFLRAEGSGPFRR